ncbi:MAG TPA: hypothetical protein VK559_08485 [Ferruginibacter sp.]|nr:hypothetical protein [Ferruginibacter sp.]
MKFLISLIITAALSFAICLYCPWWSIAIIAFIVAVLIPQKPFVAFLSGFFALFIFWFVLTLYISNNNEHILAHKVSMIILKSDNPFALILITALIGALVAGFAALAGSFARKTK